MPEFRITPTRGSKVVTTGELNPRFFGKIDFPWDQVADVNGAIQGMQERAAEGVAEGTNRAAVRIREFIINEIAELSTLSRERIAQDVHVDADASEDMPAARVRIEYSPVLLSEFDHWQDARGVQVRQKRDEGERRIPAAFMGMMSSGHAGIFQRVMKGGKRVGRLPIKEPRGESVKSMVENTPGLMDRIAERGSGELVEQISEVRNEIVQQFTRENTVLAMIIPGAGSAVRLSTLPIALARGVFTALRRVVA